ncbi:DUF1709-domain-containing protein [Aspergillus avenaceus]|uniref:DUF1709-domain-containing protein n=1 Tax=Aspergillus avenaceus TaxID=36643 RepID=A0A5N6TTQ1_ASPAV|nr:DUF1709-domain-containing protein [Aspergillus avenaceus]
MGNGTGQRPLSEVSPTAQRRNSPIWNQSTKMMRNSNDVDVKSSPRLFWQGRESGSPFQRSQENQAPYDPEAPSTKSKRPSIENLKRQSRVRNSSMLRDYNQDYDPANVYIPQRPLATNRSPQRPAKQESGPIGPRPPSPSKEQAPPPKSSLSRASRFGVKDAAFDPESEIWSDGDRHAKSVTFDAAPPQVNEYEMTTPDPSSIASESREGSYESDEDEFPDISFDHDSLTDRDDSFDASLEDLEKTPVVMPEDWRYMSPSTANDDLVKEDDDPFTEDEEARPDPEPSTQEDATDQHSRMESLDSNGEPRPLPPLPGRTSFPPHGSAPGKLAAAFELASGGQRVLPSPPGPASYSKADIADFGSSSMPLEGRLRLMKIQEKGQDDTEHKDEKEVVSPSQAADEQNEAKETHDKEAEEHETETGDEIEGDATEAFRPPRISRDSILRDLRRSESLMDDSFDTSQLDESSYMTYDPDVPIPSLENDDDMYDESENDDDDDTNSVVIKPEENDDDLYDIPDYYGTVPSKDSTMKSLNEKLASDDESRYSSQHVEEDHTKGSESLTPEGQTTPVPAVRKGETTDEQTPTEAQPEPERASKMAAIRETLQRPLTPEDEDQLSEPSTPDSVIRHPVEEDASDCEISEEESIPDPVATIKAPGTGLKARPSLTPADLESMAATRRRISGQHPPAMPSLSKQNSNESEKSAPDDAPSTQSTKDIAQRQSSLVKLDIPFSIQEESLGFGLDKEFDRVIENQKVAFEKSLSQLYSRTTCVTETKEPLHHYGLQYADDQFPKQRGYLMRHNTKVIVASSRNEDEPTPSAGGSTDSRAGRSTIPTPRKPSQQTWTTVPWNGQPRRPSIRQASGIRKKPVPGAVPPLPGQPSNVQETPATIDESDLALNGALDEGEERGRLFVKVVGMKYLDLPVPRGERSYFSLTLDNGLHCVTTAWLELGKTAPIGQEFELIVQNDLEFQLTLQMKVDEEKFRVQEPPPTASPTRQKASTFSRVFASPRKRKELDLKQQLASQQQKSKDVNAGVWDRLRTLIAQDGSFGRAYVALSDHEKHAFGRPYTVDIACFNEWAVEEQPSSVKSKKSTSSTSQRRPPYKIGKLELQLLFVPKPKGGKDEDMPKSMNACIREMRDAENVSARSWEGYLSQQGGDCPYWRRRFFKLQGSKLTAYHETTRQPRATINLSKAAKLIDDRSSLMQKETTTRGGGRRKSAFAEEEEGYMFVEEGFRIRFGNGEVIDFYADSAADKDGWMKVLADAVGKGSSGSSQVKAWTELVLKRERSVKSRRETTDRRLDGDGPPPPPPVKDAPPPPTTTAPAAAPPRVKHRYTQSQPEVRSADTRRQKARSLIF